MGSPRYHSRGWPPPRPVGAAVPAAVGVAVAVARPAWVSTFAVAAGALAPRSPRPAPPSRPARGVVSEPVRGAAGFVAAGGLPRRPPRPAAGAVDDAGAGGGVGGGVLSLPPCVSVIRIMPLWL